MVAPTNVIGPLFAVGGHNKEAVIVADEGHITFYSSRTMQKLRTQRVSDARIVGINAVTYVDPREGPQHHIHAVDVTGTYFVIDAVTNFVVSSDVMEITTAAKRKGSAKPVLGGSKPAAATADSVLSAQWTSIFDESYISETDAEGASAAADYAAGLPPGLRLVLLTPAGVFAQHVRHIVAPTPNAAPFDKVLNLPGPLSGLVMAVGKENGVVLLGQIRRTWLWIGSASGTVSKGQPLRHLTLPARLLSLAVTPQTHKSAFAVGGDRGEIAYYPTAGIPIDPSTYASDMRIGASTAPLRFFSDHWHSTPLQAIAFTEDGSALLSAAAERTLVSWSVSGAFTRTKVTSSRREELAEGYLWRNHQEAKIDKKSKFRPKARRNGSAEGSGFITTDVASIVIPHIHGSAASAASPFAAATSGCYVVGVTGEVAAMDLREQRVTATADGVRWSMAAGIATAPHSAAPSSALQHAEAVEWMGRPALMVVSPRDAEVRIIDPLTQQSLYTHHVRYCREAASAAVVGSASAAAGGASAGGGLMESYFEENRAAVDAASALGAVGGLLVAVADGGRLLFTCEDLSHIGIDSVLRVWRYDADKRRHVEVQAIHRPHATEVLQMTVASVRPRRAAGDGSADECVTMLFTMDRLGVKCWRSVELPRHEARGGASAASGPQRNFLHLGGLAGSNGEKEADASLWRVVGTNRCPSGRASCFALSEDGTIILVADEVVSAYEVPTADLAVAFAPGRKGVGFAVADWEHLFSLAPPRDESGPSGAVQSLSFIVGGGALPSVFARFKSSFACCWQANASAEWSVAWQAPGVHSLLSSASGGEGGALAITYAAAADEGAAQKGIAVRSATFGGAASPSATVYATLPEPFGPADSAAYVLLPSDGAGPSASSTPLLRGRLMRLDASGVRHIHPQPVAAPATAASPAAAVSEEVETFAEPSSHARDSRIDAFFSGLGAAAQTAALADGSASAASSASAAQQLLARVIGSEAYAAPPMGLVLSSLLAAAAEVRV